MAFGRAGGAGQVDRSLRPRRWAHHRFRSSAVAARGTVITEIVARRADVRGVTWRCTPDQHRGGHVAGVNDEALAQPVL